MTCSHVVNNTPVVRILKAVFEKAKNECDAFGALSQSASELAYHRKLQKAIFTVENCPLFASDDTPVAVYLAGTKEKEIADRASICNLFSFDGITVVWDWTVPKITGDNVTFTKDPDEVLQILRPLGPTVFLQID